MGNKNRAPKANETKDLGNELAAAAAMAAAAQRLNDAATLS